MAVQDDAGGGVRSALRVLELDAARWRAVLDTARDAIISIDRHGRITLFNRSAEEIFGYRAEEVLGRNVMMLMPPPYREEHDEYLARYADTGVAKAIGRIRDVEGQRKTGEVFPIELSVSEARIGDDVIYSAIVRDVTEHRRMKHELERRALQQAATAELGLRAVQATLSELLDETVAVAARTLGVEYAKILELMPGGGLLLRAGIGWKDGLVGRAMVDAGRDSMVGCTLRGNEPVVVEDLRSDARFGATSFLHDHGVVSGISVIVHGPHGPYGTLSAHSTKPRRFTVDDVNFLQTIANVVAEAIERRHAEAESERFSQLAQQRERLADIGVLTTKIVHDVGNPLAGLSMLAARIKRRTDREPTAPIGVCREAVEEIESTVHRLDTIIRDFKSFARVQRLELADVHLPTFLKEVVVFWEPEATTRGIGLRLDSDDPSPIRVDREKLRRAIDNLVKNALEAIEHGPGTISIASHVLTTGNVGIMIADDGPGIPGEVEAFRLFETTKPNGTGLGLPIVREIVVAHGGGIDFARGDPCGTCFNIELPRGGPAASMHGSFGPPRGG